MFKIQTCGLADLLLLFAAIEFSTAEQRASPQSCLPDCVHVKKRRKMGGPTSLLPVQYNGVHTLQQNPRMEVWLHEIMKRVVLMTGSNNFRNLAGGSKKRGRDRGSAQRQAVTRHPELSRRCPSRVRAQPRRHAMPHTFWSGVCQAAGHLLCTTQPATRFPRGMTTAHTNTKQTPSGLRSKRFAYLPAYCAAGNTVCRCRQAPLLSR